MKSAWLKAWLVCGTLDIAFAIGVTLVQGKDVGGLLRGVAAGPFGDGADGWGLGGALLGLLVNFAIMAVMTLVLAVLLCRTPLGRWH